MAVQWRLAELRKDDDLDPFFEREEQTRASVEPLFTWHQVQEIACKKEIWNLTRHPSIETIYANAFFPAVKAKYGTPSGFVAYRLSLPPATGERRAFTSDVTDDQFWIQLNSWPYSLPRDVQHLLVWTRHKLIDRSHFETEEAWNRAVERGIVGLTGDVAPELIQNNTQSKSANGQSIANDQSKEGDGSAIRDFVLARWPESSYDTVYFVNPPRYQSIPDLAHFHVLVKPKAQQGQ